MRKRPILQLIDVSIEVTISRDKDNVTRNVGGVKILIFLSAKYHL